MTPPVRPAWLRTLALFALGLALATALGLVTGYPWQTVAVAALSLLGWHSWKLQRLLQRLTTRQRPPPSDAAGAWNELDRLLYRGHAEMRNRKRRLIEMLRAYRATAAALPDAIVVVDRNSQRVLWFNQAGTALLGLRYPGDIGAPLVQRLQPLPLAHWLTAGRHAETLEVGAPGNPAIRLNLRLIPYSENLWLLVARDISRLLHLEQMRRDFVANVSHELRTPLTVIHGYLDMIDHEEHAELAPMLGEMQRQSQRMAQLVEDLLALSRLESQDTLRAEEVVPMGWMLDTLQREAMALSQGRHQVSVEDRAAVDLWGSTRELHSAFSNLVGNAVRYTPDGGDIVIRFRTQIPREGTSTGRSGGAVLEVVDSGHGIAAEHLPRLTERFYRVSTSRSRESGGTGLGLAIVKHILQRHQAQLAISSQPGNGSTFSCHFGAERLRARKTDASGDSAPPTSEASA
ncbi:MAG: phosphate regulon sensor histidine kinase PhoR [Lysobacter sp.]